MRSKPDSEDQSQKLSSGSPMMALRLGGAEPIGDTGTPSWANSLLTIDLRIAPDGRALRDTGMKQQEEITRNRQMMARRRGLTIPIVYTIPS